MKDKVAQATEIAERHFEDFRVTSLTRYERNQFVAALGLKLPLAYGSLLLLRYSCVVSVLRVFGSVLW